MNKRQSNEMQSIRKKLLAAIAMLLIACIMTVSSTYAWFTLSTAPEVKGITTTVGANGNLEIALGNYNTVYEGGKPASGEGTSMDKADVTAVQANVTWGNLIDLSDASYGLGAIMLYPSRLYTNTAAMVSNGTPLKYAKYGNDGRVINLADALKGSFESGGFTYDVSNPAAGVSGIGSATGISERALALMNYKNAYVSNSAAALTAAKTSMSLYGSDLASLMVQHINATQGGGTDGNNYKAYVPQLKGMVEKLKDSNGYVGNALKAAVLSYLASREATLDGNALTDEGWKTFNTAYSTKTIEEIMANVSGYGVNSTLTNYYNDTYVDVGDKITAAETAVDALTTKDNVTWEDINTVVKDLVDSGNITVCNQTIADIKTDPSDVLKALSDKGLTVEIGNTDGKVYSKLADMVGTISGAITFKEGTIVSAASATVNLSGFTATLYSYPSSTVQLAAGENKGLLSTLEGGIVDYEAPDATTDVQALTDTYGYAVDMLFRTNATDSKLLLQVAGANRVYNDDQNKDKNADLMGGGSNMTFTATQEFQADKVTGLMDAIRVVFYETPESATGQGKILAVATLDTANKIVEADKVKANLQLVEFSYNDEGIFTKGAVKDNAEITALSANVEKRITALVYLDGDVITNEHVSALENINGMLNLQFASSASLVPMKNNNLINGANS